MKKEEKKQKKAESKKKLDYYSSNVGEAVDLVVNSKLSTKKIRHLLRTMPLSKKAKEDCIREVKLRRGEIE